MWDFTLWTRLMLGSSWCPCLCSRWERELDQTKQMLAKIIEVRHTVWCVFGVYTCVCACVCVCVCVRRPDT